MSLQPTASTSTWAFPSSLVSDQTSTARLLPQLSTRASSTESSAIRDLLSQARQPGMISLAGGLPDAGLFPTDELAQLAASIIGEPGGDVLQYGVTAGDEHARAALTSLFSPGTKPDEILLTTGSQQGLDLLARTLIDRGDSVVVGDPDYLGALQVFRSFGADIRSVGVDADGLITEQLEVQLRAGLRPKCCYVVPHFHNPTGVTLSAERRRHLDELAANYGFLIVEDDPYRELFYDSEPPAEHVVDLEHTVQLRSTSKTLAPGLRLGALRGPAWLLNPLTTAKQSTDLHTSSLSQSIAAAAVTSSWMAGHLDGLRTAYGAKRDGLIDALQSTFQGDVEFVTPSGGMFVWAHFAHINDTAEWLVRCLDQGVCFVPGAAFAVDRDLSQYARLSFATGSIAEQQQGIRRMASC